MRPPSPQAVHAALGRRLATALALAAAAPLRPGRALDAAADAEAFAAGVRSGGRGANALNRPRAETGVKRTGSVENPLFAAGQILDEVRSEDGTSVAVSFSFPEEWTLAGGPNLDVRDVAKSDSAFLLSAPLPSGASLERLPVSFFEDMLYDRAGKYGAYGGVDERAVLSAEVVSRALPTGGTQPYRLLSLKFAPLTFNSNVVERRALVSATAVGGSVFMLSCGCQATRFKKAAAELAATQASFRAYAAGRARPAAAAGAASRL